MFGKKKELVYPVRDKNRQKVVETEQKFAAIGQIADPGEKFLALNAFAQKLAQIKEDVSQDITNFVRHRNSVRENKVAGGVLGGSACGLALMYAALGGVGIGIGVLPVMVGGLAILDAACDSPRALLYKRIECEDSCAEIGSLNRMTAALDVMRQKFFEASDCVSALVGSPDFPEIFMAAKPVERQILSAAFRMSAEKKDVTGQKHIESRPFYFQPE